MKKAKIQLEYNTQIVNIDLEHYKTLGHIKDKAKQVFYPLSFDNKCLLMSNKDLSAFDNHLIGDYFKGKNFIHLKIGEKQKPKESLTFNPNASIEDKKKYEDLFDPEDDVLVSRKIKISKNGTQEKSRQKLDENSLCECKNDVISYYCRKCKEYLCKSCRIKQEHYNHKTVLIDLYTGLEDSVRLYALNVQAEAGLCLKACKMYEDILKAKKNLLDFSKRKRIILEKIDQFEQRANEFISRLPPMSSNDSLEKLDQANVNLNKEVDRIISEIENNYANSSTKYSIEKLTLSKAQDLIDEISSKESDIESYSEEVLKYKLNYDIHSKLNEMYQVIERAIDASLSLQYRFTLSISTEEKTFIPNEMINTLKQTANSRSSSISDKIKKLRELNAKNDQTNEHRENNYHDDTPIIHHREKERENQPEENANIMEEDANLMEENVDKGNPEDNKSKQSNNAKPKEEEAYQDFDENIESEKNDKKSQSTYMKAILNESDKKDEELNEL